MAGPQVVTVYAALPQDHAESVGKVIRGCRYFRRNLRTIGVILDREAILNGAPGRGEPWKYYHLGHGYCANEFFSQCVHRMACARCSFYVPKQSQVASLLEARTANDRLLQEIPLTDDERAAVDGDAEAVDRLIADLQGVPAPDGRIKVETGSRV